MAFLQRGYAFIGVIQKKSLFFTEGGNKCQQWFAASQKLIRAARNVDNQRVLIPYHPLACFCDPRHIWPQPDLRDASI